MEWEIKLRESISYWERRLKLIDGKKDAFRVENVRRNLRLMTDAEIYERKRI